MVVAEEMNALAFRLFSDSEIRRMSVLEIVTPNSFDSIDHPIKGGLYDLVMGPSGMQTETCLTCKQTTRHCPGHMGHIELPLPVVNPFFQKEVVMLLRNACHSCKKINVELRYKYLLIYQLKLLNAGYIMEAQEIADVIKDPEGSQLDMAQDIAIKDKLLEYVKLKNLSLDREVPFTKTSESLRKQFLDNYNKRVDVSKQCLYCKSKVFKVVKHGDQIIAPEEIIETTDSAENKNKSAIAIFPNKSKQMLRAIWKEEEEFIESILPILKYREEKVIYGTDLLFMNVILVPPPKVRPLIFVRGRGTEHQQSRLFKDVLKKCIILRELMRAAISSSYENLNEEIRAYIQGIVGDNLAQKLQQSWLELQISVDTLLTTYGRAPLGLLGLKQLIEKKEGILRKHMMGKRVNYAARSVITPDPNLLIQEIGIPEQFAKKLTYPVKANFFNVHELRKMVKNGPDVYPGANIVEMENGSVIRLMPGEKYSSKRDGVAKLLLKSVESGGGKIVHRHLLNGDILLLNRQPTLHRPSIMAHKARILKGEKTLRMHYSNCKSYNADFDGDEMNAHFPQTEIARSEAYNIVGVKDNYLVPKDGTPLGGLIQDHIISGVKLTVRGQFFNKEDYYQLVYQGLSHCKGDIKLLPPTILKPKMLWSGKQIISTILMNIIPKNKALISLHSKTKIRDDSWRVQPPRPWKCGKEFKNKNEMSESNVIIHGGHLLCGVLDKQHYGATPYGLTHCLYELYGGSCSMKFLDSVGKLFTAYLQFNGFSLGIKDILINENEDRKRTEIIKKVQQIGEIASKNALDLEDVPVDLEEKLEAAYYGDKIKFKARLDQEYKKILNSYTNDINGACIPGGLLTRFPKNNLQLMVTSGAKGSTVNTMQISCLLGQIELEGKRPPLMISGKSLPSFKAFETNPRAGGYVHARFMTGISPQDFFFHCMAGREGLIDTAVKTARSGYLQRCLIKNLEGVRVCYDGTVRDHDNSVVQFAYGEDGLEVQKSTFLKQDQMDFLYRNKNSIIDESVLQILKDSLDVKKVEKHKRRIRAWNDEWKSDKWRKSCSNGFALFSAHIRDQIKEKYWHRFDKSTGRCKASHKIVKKWNELDEKSKNAYKSIRPDPVITKFNRNRDFGVITEKLEDLIEGYLGTKSRHNKSENTVRNIINIKYISSLCQPGEAVGLLAAQSIGEPSTQMTLNTFHFAGRGEMNVTLGIPRLREILMSATKTIKTPYMDIPMKKKAPEKMEKLGNKLKKKFQTVTLGDVLQTIEVKEKLVPRPTTFTYNIKFTFLPFNSYKKRFCTSPKEILKFMEKDFLISLCKHIRKLGKKYGDVIYESKEEKILTRDDCEEKEKEADNRSVDLQPKKISLNSASSSEGEFDYDETTIEYLRQKRGGEGEYDEPNESDYQFTEDEVEDRNAESSQEGDENGLAVDEDNDVLMLRVSKSQILDATSRQDFVTKTFPMVISYKFDLLNEEWCEIVFAIPLSLCHIDFYSLLKEVCNNSVIYEVPNVKRAFLCKNNKGDFSLKTEGINLIEIFKYHKVLDVNKLYSNDIHEMAKVYGIEAAARVIVNELKEVFGVYGITVDPRHLLLIADFMTHQGVYSPFSRMGIATNPSPLQQMSFESTISFLKDALTWSKKDVLSSPSARIMAGKFCNSGTGCFDLINEGVYSMRNKNQTKEIRVCSGTGFQ